MKSLILDRLPPLPYELAPNGAEDKYWLTRDVTFRWRNPPGWISAMFAGGGFFICPEGCLRFERDPDGTPVLALTVRAHFCFAVSAAPDFARALAAACLHDFLYKHSAEIAAFFGVGVRTVLAIADHWFLAQMRASGFLLKEAYFCGVRLFGHWFHSLFSKELS
jgi:hypothetical protein